MKFRRETLQQRLSRHINRGLYGLGVLVVGLSITQGITGVIGVVLMIFIVSCGVGLVLWVARLLESLVASRRGVE